MLPADFIIVATTLGVRIDRAREHAPHICAAMDEFGIDTVARQSAFLAQIFHESSLLRWVVELWGPTAQQRTYDSRMGNHGPEDAFRYRGRGWLQITGHDNYKWMGEDLGVDLLSAPERLGEPALAARASARYWQKTNCNRFADIGDFDGVSDTINRGRKTAAFGDAIGYHERVALYEAAKDVMA